MTTFWRAFSSITPAVAALFAGGYYFYDGAHSFASTQLETRPPVNHTDNKYFNKAYPLFNKWDRNWDNREPSTLINQSKYDAANDEKKQKILKKVTPTATRHIFLIRHGQYILNSEKKNLTELGREQATILGKRLAESNFKFNKVIISTMNRATETAQLMLEQLDKNIKKESNPMVEEGAPYPPEPEIVNWKPKPKDFFTDGSRIEAAFRKFIHRASPKQKEDSYEVIVCHGNVIRYFICRALQFPPEGWQRLSIGHTSISWLAIKPNGFVSLCSFGDVGHLPADKLTFI